MSTAKKVALVTGAASGIGKATAIAFSEAGYRTVVSDVHEQGGQETVDLITHKGGEAFFAKADVSKEEDVASLMTSIKDKYGRLDAAFNNAGIDGEQAPISEYTLRAWQHVMDINLTGVFLCCKHEVPLMLEGGGGAIVNCASVLGKRGVANFPAYTASKHGVLGLTKSLALEMVKQGIRANAVCPGVIATPMVKGIVQKDPNFEDWYKSKQPIGRMGRPEEVAQAVVWLCSDAASFVTGTGLDVDGAWMA